MELLLRNLPFILQGLGMTLTLALATLFFATIISFALGTLATLRFAWLRIAVKVYVELFRDIPLVVNIFFVFFVAPLFGMELTPFTAVTVSLSLWGSANGTEIVRSGLASVPTHQWQSAAALGLASWEVYLFVIGPQALRSILPPFVGLLTLLVQATSLGALVGVTEFFKVGQIIVERSTVMEGWNPAFTVYGAVLLIYFVICSSLSWTGRRLERHLQQGLGHPSSTRAGAPAPVPQLP